MISQLARAAFAGRGPLYLAAIGATTLILVMAANTAYADFPRLAALQAADGYLPRQLTYRGSRLVYSRGIVVLALVASLLIWIFSASVTGPIPLYAIGVFLSFTLSQAGMARRWCKSGRLAPGEEVRERGSLLQHDPRWRFKMAANGVGAVITAKRQPNEVITIVVPQFVPRKRWHNLLHAQTALMLRLALLFRTGIVVTSIPYHVGQQGL